MYQVFAYNSGGQTVKIYDSSDFPSSKTFTRGVYDLDTSDSGSMNFTIAKNHPHYNMFRILSTYVYVLRDQTEVTWFGRVRSINRDFRLNKNITCEGPLAFLNDIIICPFHYWEQTGYDETSSKPTYSYRKVSKTDHLNTIMDYYNSVVSEYSDRIISLSVYPPVGDDGSSSSIWYKLNIDGSSSYTTVLDEIKNSILEDYSFFYIPNFYINSDFGSNNFGRILTSISVQTYGYKYPLINFQDVETGINLLDLSIEETADNAYNSIIALGEGDMSYFNQNGDEDPPELGLSGINPLIARNRGFVSSITGYPLGGPIDHVINFSDISDRQDLWTASNYAASRGIGCIPETIDVNAVDLHWLDQSVVPFNIGQMIKIKHSINILTPNKEAITDPTAEYICSHVTVDILDPTNCSYTFTNPYSSIERNMTDKITRDIVDVRKDLNERLMMNAPKGLTVVREDGFVIRMKSDDTSS